MTSGEKRVYPDGKPISLEDFLAAPVIEYARVPGFKPGQVFVIQSVSAGEIISWSEASEGDAKRTAGLRLIIKSVVDGDPTIDPTTGKQVDEGAKGVPILDDSHIAVLRKMPHKVTEQVVKAILKHNGMQTKQEAAAKND